MQNTGTWKLWINLSSMYAVLYLQLKHQLCPKQRQFLQPRRQRAAVRTPVMIQTRRRRRSQQRLSFLSSIFNVHLTVMNNSKFTQKNCTWNWAQLSWTMKCPGCCRSKTARAYFLSKGRFAYSCYCKFNLYMYVCVYVKRESSLSFFLLQLWSWSGGKEEWCQGRKSDNIVH